MRVVCIHNRPSRIEGEAIRRRIARSIHLDVVAELAVGKEYLVQAIQESDDGLVFFVHSIDEIPYPTPYPAEMFDVRDGTIPAGWCVALRDCPAGKVIKRVAFYEWAHNDDFYEMLVDGNSTATDAYQRMMARN